jgi:hypothetical protein
VRLTAHALPALALCVDLPAHGVGPGVWAAAGAAWILQYARFRSAPVLLLGAATLNVAVIGYLWRFGASDTQLYALPVGLTAVVLGQVYRNSLSRPALASLRYGGASVVYLASLYESLQTPLASLGLVGLALVGIVAGGALRIRSFLYLGVSALVFAVGMNAVRFGLANQFLLALFLTATGLLVLVSMVVFTAKRAALAAARDRMRTRLKAWEP